MDSSKRTRPVDVVPKFCQAFAKNVAQDALYRNYKTSHISVGRRGYARKDAGQVSGSEEDGMASTNTQKITPMSSEN